MINKYNPVFIDDFKLHLKLIPKLKALYKKDISNILLYGNYGTGKLTIARCLINSYYKKEIICKDNIITINSKESKFKSSEYHFELILDRYFNKKKFDDLLRYLSSNLDINNNCIYKLIIIKNIEHIPYESLMLLKNIIEKNDKIRFILITNNISKLNNFYKGFFLLIRIPKLEKDELYNYLIQYYNKNNVKKILDNNLNNIFPILDINDINKYIEPYESNINKLIKLLESKKISNIIKIRELLYNLMSKNYDLKFIFNKIYKYFLNKCNEKKKKEIITIYSENSQYINKSFKSIIHYETLLINIMNIIK